jgi:tRNA1(Val) A37 N6-methylase TrmN6
MIHRADALPALLQAMKGRYGGLEILPVFSQADRPAIRVLVRGRLGSRAPISLHPPLILHEPDGAFTAQARAINEGRMAVPFLSA